MKIEKGKELDYQKAFDINDDPYGRRIFTYAEDWAKLMENVLESGTALDAEAAEQFSHDADTDGITGFMYDMARAILYRYWEYGTELLDLLGNKMTSIITIGE